MSDDQFKKNLQRWELFYPKEAHLLSNLDCQNTRIQNNSNGEPNLAINLEGQWVCLHSTENPQEEARLWFNSLDLANIDVILVYGVGLGYYYDAVTDWLHRRDNRALIFIEDNLEVIYRLLETDRGTALLHDKQVWLTPLSSDHFLLQFLSAEFVLKPYVFSALAFYGQHKAQTLNLLKTKYAFYLNLQAGVAIEYSDHGRSFFTNFFKNMFSLPEAYLGDSLYGKFKGIPAIICGAGPSIGKNLPVLETLRDRALIFAGGTAMNALNSRGFLPHFGVGIDPNPAQFTRLIMNQAYEVPFLYRNRFLHEALEIIHGDHLYVTGTGGYEISQWFENKLGIENGVRVSEGHNVVNFNVSLAQAMGCNPIILVGVDLAYTDSKSYAPGVINHPLHEHREFYRTKSVDEDVISQIDIYGQPTLTLWKWVTESLWFTNFAKSNQHITLVNATEGGIGFSEVPNMPLSATMSLLKKQYDFDGMVWTEIQNAPLPPTASQEGVLKTMEEFQESLKRSLEYCQIIRSDFEDTERQLKEEEKMPENIISEKAIEALSALEQEIAYTHLLKVFSDSYLDRFMREFHRLTYDETLLTELEINLKRVSLNSARYKFLRETAKVILKIIEQVLKIETDERMFRLMRSNQQKPESASIPLEAEDHDHYSFENDILEIRSPGVGVEIKEKFVPDELIGKVTENYPSGSLKLIQYQLDGNLHGPSIYYSKEGKTLSESWFFKGLKQGRGLTYYANGALHSKECFKDDKKEGIQEYYYPNGQVKSLLSYAQGQLNGDVKLYYPSGRLKRELHFEAGKRKGFERLWNDIGTLTIEAEFDADKPVGTARRWYPNGNIAKEVVYTPDSDSCVIREWDEMGQTFIREQRAQGDYFDQVSRHTDKLTEVLHQVLNQVIAVAPLVELSAAPDKKKEAANFLTEDIAQLQKGMTALEEINKKLAFETGIDASNKEEAIWKGPSSRKEVEKQIDLMTKEMTSEMNNMQNALVTALGLLSKKLNQMQAEAKSKESAAAATQAEGRADEKKEPENEDKGKQPPPQQQEEKADEQK